MHIAVHAVQFAPAPTRQMQCMIECLWRSQSYFPRSTTSKSHMALKASAFLPLARMFPASGPRISFRSGAPPCPLCAYDVAAMQPATSDKSPCPGNSVYTRHYAIGERLDDSGTRTMRFQLIRKENLNPPRNSWESQ